MPYTKGLPSVAVPVLIAIPAKALPKGSLSLFTTIKLSLTSNVSYSRVFAVPFT
jgi:hypothetical protein